MVEFVYEPFKKIVVHEIALYDFQTFIYQRTLGVQMGQLGGPINWVDGVAFIHVTMPPTPEVITEQLHGKIHWQQLAFTFMPQYQPFIVIPEGNIKIPVVKLSNNLVFKNMVIWLKQSYKEV